MRKKAEDQEKKPLTTAKAEPKAVKSEKTGKKVPPAAAETPAKKTRNKKQDLESNPPGKAAETEKPGKPERKKRASKADASTEAPTESTEKKVKRGRPAKKETEPAPQPEPVEAPKKRGRKAAKPAAETPTVPEPVKSEKKENVDPSATEDKPKRKKRTTASAEKGKEEAEKQIPSPPQHQEDIQKLPPHKETKHRKSNAEKKIEAAKEKESIPVQQNRDVKAETVVTKLKKAGYRVEEDRGVIYILVETREKFDDLQNEYVQIVRDAGWNRSCGIKVGKDKGTHIAEGAEQIENGQESEID